MQEDENDNQIRCSSVTQSNMFELLAFITSVTSLPAHSSEHEKQCKSYRPHKSMKAPRNERSQNVPALSPTCYGPANEGDANNNKRCPHKSVSVGFVTKEGCFAVLSLEVMAFFTSRILPPYPDQ